MKQKNETTNPGSCGPCRARLQEYLDETLPGREATQVFLHVRDCDACRRELEELKTLYGMLDALPEVPAPPDLAERVLASVPYAAYREMAPLRRPRLAVLLDEESLPAFLRAAATRVAGLGVAFVAAVGLVSGRLPDAASVLMVAGLLPEGLVRLQQFTRRIHAGAVRKSEGR